MPYIPEEERTKFNDMITATPSMKSKGELEYILYKTAITYMEDKVYNYTNMHDVVSAIQHVAHEFQRRYLDIREDQAIKENGDIL